MARPTGVFKLTNEYAGELGKLYAQTPKAVFAAIAVSALTTGGDWLDEAQPRILKEWYALYRAGIVPQKPPAPEPPDKYAAGTDPNDERYRD